MDRWTTSSSDRSRDYWIENEATDIEEQDFSSDFSVRLTVLN